MICPICKGEVNELLDITQPKMCDRCFLVIRTYLLIMTERRFTRFKNLEPTAHEVYEKTQQSSMAGVITEIEVHAYLERYKEYDQRN